MKVKNKEEEKITSLKPFFIASDEGDVWSEDVDSIMTGTDDSVTYISRRQGSSAYVSAPKAVVRDIFREHGYEIIDETDLERRIKIYQARQRPQP